MEGTFQQVLSHNTKTLTSREQDSGRPSDVRHSLELFKDSSLLANSFCKEHLTSPFFVLECMCIAVALASY
jgi:hypothetical protein